MGRYISLQGHDALPIIVTIDGVDRIGYLEAWQQDDDGDWRGYVRYAAPDPSGTFTGLHLGWFPADVIRPDEQTDEHPPAPADDAPAPTPQPPHQDDEEAH